MSNLISQTKMRHVGGLLSLNWVCGILRSGDGGRGVHGRWGGQAGTGIAPSSQLTRGAVFNDMSRVPVSWRSSKLSVVVCSRMLDPRTAHEES